MKKGVKSATAIAVELLSALTGETRLDLMIEHHQHLIDALNDNLESLKIFRGDKLPKGMYMKHKGGIKC